MPTTNTRTVKPAGGDYTSLSNWEAGRQANLVTGDIIEVAECYSMEDTTAVTIDGWTTDATRYIRIYTPTAERHAGTWSDSKYRLTGTNVDLLVVKEEYTRIEGVQFSITATITNIACVKVGQLAAASDVRLGYNLYRSITSGAGGAPFAVWLYDDADGNCAVTDYDSIAYDFYNTDFPNSVLSFGWYCQYGILTTYNCTAYRCSTGFKTFGATYKIKAINCLSYCDEVNANYLDFAGTFHADSNYNCSTDATAPGVNSLVNQASTDIDFLSVTAGNADFLDIDTTSTVYAAGVTNPGSGLYSDDIRARTWNAAWAIGANRGAAAATGSFLLRMQTEGLYVGSRT